MDIFGVHIFGDDAEAWLKLCKEQKTEWILKRTNQTDLNLISEFVSNPKITKECKCLNCEKNGSVSKRVPKEDATVINIDNVTEYSREDSIERPKSVKGRKDK